MVVVSSNQNGPQTTDLYLPSSPLSGIGGVAGAPPGSGEPWTTGSHGAVGSYIPQYSLKKKLKFWVENIVWPPVASTCSFNSSILPLVLVSQYISNLDSVGSVS